MLKRYFGSFAPWIEAFCEIDPEFPMFILAADRQTRHFVCSVLAYADPPLDESLDVALARAIRTERRNRLLEKCLGEHVPGLGRAIGKLMGKPWSRDQYWDLYMRMGIPEKAHILRHLPRIRPAHVEAVSSLPTAFRKYRIIEPIKSRSDVSALIAAHCIATRVRTDLDERAIARALEDAVSAPENNRPSDEKVIRMRRFRSIGRDSYEEIVEHWLESFLGSVTFTEIPWEGSNSIRPVRTAKELRGCGREFKNCLEDHIPGGAVGESSYFQHVAEPRAIIQAKRVGSLGWGLVEILGPKNKKIAEEDCRRIEAQFVEAGFMPRIIGRHYDFYWLMR